MTALLDYSLPERETAARPHRGARTGGLPWRRPSGVREVGSRCARRWVRPLLMAGCLACGVSACSRSSAPPAAETDGLRKEFERGPVRVVLAVDRKELTVADRLQLTIDVISEEEYEAQWPRFGDRLEQFGIVDYRTLPPKLVGDHRVRIRRSYELEPFLAGTYTIPSMTIAFRKKNNETEAGVHQIETEPIEVTVTSLLPRDTEEISIREAGDPVDVPRSQAAIVAWGGALGLLCMAALGAVLLARRRRRRRQAAEARRIPADELALRDLEKLVAAGLPERGEIKRFYRCISDIVRTYIERRFGLHAPEQTTEEFLAAIGGARDFPDRYRPLLDMFLTHCDLVKFAEFQPSRDEIQQTVESCTSFITGTKEAPEAPAPTVRKLDY